MNLSERVRLPSIVTPAAVAVQLGVSERRVRKIARDIGACRIFGKTMVLLQQDVDAIVAALAGDGGTAAELRDQLNTARQELADERAKFNEERRQAMMRDTHSPALEGFVYFLRCRDRVKIGFATNVEARVKELRTGSAYPQKLLASMRGTLASEKEVHHRFAHLRTKGEWFKAMPELLEYIEEVRNG